MMNMCDQQKEMKFIVFRKTLFTKLSPLYQPGMGYVIIS